LRQYGSILVYALFWLDSKNWEVLGKYQDKSAALHLTTVQPTVYRIFRLSVIT